MDTVFKALADPTRRRILRLLNSREMTAGELAAHFQISAPSMSHHFNVLKAADLVETRRDGQLIYYSLNTTVFQDVLTVIMELFTTDKEEGPAA
jgi:DNA-binding transcriptional ArsR family regulator